ncbi:MAG: hypothetical protein OSJ62_02135 [Lachnospiraceae bacterium]|nr:hypothetical protein [Lachnospiraceae bacterium]
MTIKNYLESLGIDGTVILSEETKTEAYICHAFHLKRKSQPKKSPAASSNLLHFTPAVN